MRSLSAGRRVVRLLEATKRRRSCRTRGVRPGVVESQSGSTLTSLLRVAVRPLSGGVDRSALPELKSRAGLSSCVVSESSGGAGSTVLAVLVLVVEVGDGGRPAFARPTLGASNNARGQRTKGGAEASFRREFWPDFSKSLPVGCRVVSAVPRPSAAPEAPSDRSVVVPQLLVRPTQPPRRRAARQGTPSPKPRRLGVTYAAYAPAGFSVVVFVFAHLDPQALPPWQSHLPVFPAATRWSGSPAGRHTQQHGYRSAAPTLFRTMTGP